MKMTAKDVLIITGVFTVVAFIYVFTTVMAPLIGDVFSRASYYIQAYGYLNSKYDYSFWISAVNYDIVEKSYSAVVTTKDFPDVSFDVSKDGNGQFTDDLCQLALEDQISKRVGGYVNQYFGETYQVDVGISGSFGLLNYVPDFTDADWMIDGLGINIWIPKDYKTLSETDQTGKIFSVLQRSKTFSPTTFTVVYDTNDYSGADTSGDASPSAPTSFNLPTEADVFSVSHPQDLLNYKV